MAIKFKDRKGGRGAPPDHARKPRGGPGSRRKPPASAGERPPPQPGASRQATPGRSPKPAREASRPPRDGTYRAERRAPGGELQNRGSERRADRAEQPARLPPRQIERSARPAAPPPAAVKAPSRAAPPRDSGTWLFGRHAVAAALANPARRVHRFLAIAETADDAASLIVATGARLPPGRQPEILSRAAFEALVPAGAVHQGIALAAERLPELAIEDVIDRVGPPPTSGTVTQIVILLDQVSDPHNIGAVLRSAAAFGALALVIPEHGTPPITGALAKAASGAIEHVPIIRVVNLVRTIDRLKSAGFWCVGLDEAAQRPLAELALEGRIALVLGGEGEGMRRLTRERCDLVARLPTSGAIGSLNVSNAAAIALYELVRGAPARA